MKRNISTAQSGYALILMVLGLMGIGGVVLAGFTQGARQQTEHERYLHNQRVLREAKQALLQYAYDYPQLGPGQDDGPGRLPCPDIDDDGNEDYVPNCGGNIFGRFPWAEAELNFYEARDASGETLWYAVSPDFGRGPGSIINSASFGGITVEDRSGAMLYDGTAVVPAGGVAAVIIAPGAPIDRNGTLQVRGTDDEKEDAVNYLDLFGTRDNSDFVNDNLNGFVTGPIFDVVTGDLLVNDQMIVITAAEVIAMAEQATLQAYRTAILDYLSPSKANGVYPWLYNYKDVVDLAELNEKYPADMDFIGTERPEYLGNYGRIPSIFSDYFTETDSQEIDTDVTGSFVLIDSATPDTVNLTEVTCDNRCGTGGSRDFGHDPGDPPTLDFEFPEILTAARFVDVDPDSVTNEVRFTATLPAAVSVDFELFFLGAHNEPDTNWTACPGGANEISDCFFTSGGNRSILRVAGTIDFDDVVLNYDFNSATPDIAWSSADAASHAWISGTYPISAVVSMPGVFSGATYVFDGHWHAGDTEIDDGDYDEDISTGTLDIGDFTRTSLTLGLRYYPELPGWALENGWHNALRMAYADDHRPDILGACNVTPDDDCLKTTDLADVERNNRVSLLVIAGEHDWSDDNDPGLQDDLADVFDAGNAGDDEEFLVHDGNDKILVIEEL